MEKATKTIIDEALKIFEYDTNQNVLRIDMNDYYKDSFLSESLDVFLPYYKGDMVFKLKISKLHDQAMRIVDSDYTNLHHRYIPLYFNKTLSVDNIKINGKKMKIKDLTKNFNKIEALHVLQ